MNDLQQRHVFISYVRENKKQVDRLCQDLESSGVNVWLDRKSIKPGARWKDAIREAIRYGDFFIACFSNEYTSKTKTHMNEELTLATEELRQYASDREWFIPVLLSECDVPARSIGAGETLLDINWVPLYDDWEAGIQRILSVIKPVPLKVQDLISALRLDDKDFRVKAAENLSKIGIEAIPAAQALCEALKDFNADVRQAAAKALGKIGRGAIPAAPALCEALKDLDKNVRRAAAEVLCKIGTDAVPLLIKALKDVDRNVRRAAAEILGKIGPDANASVPFLIKALKDKDNYVRARSAHSLGNIGTAAKTVVQSLNETLMDNSNDVRRAAAGALGRIGSTAVPVLIAALKDNNVRIYAEKALQKIGPGAKDAVPSLIELLQDEDKDVRWNAAKALKKISPKATPYVRALTDVLEDKDQNVRDEVMEALLTINTPEVQKALEEYKQKSK